MNNCYIYIHLKPCGEIFYVGIGKQKNFKRAYSRFNRNEWWKNIARKYGYEVQILKKNIDYNLAKELEILLINYFGRKDLNKGTLVNLTDGGEGTLNKKWTEESRNKLGKAHKGKTISNETREKLRDGRRKGKNHALFGVPCSEKTKLKISLANKGNKGLKGSANPMFGNISPNAKKVKNLITGEVFKSIKLAAESCNMNFCTLRSKLNPKHKLKNNTPFVYE